MTTITPAHVQYRANRDGKPWHLIGNTIVDNDDLIAWYGGALPDGALTFTPAVIDDEPFACYTPDELPLLIQRDDPPGSDPDPDTGLGSSSDEGDDPDAYHCRGNWSSHHIQQCPDILNRLLAPDLTPEQEQRFITFRDSIRARFAELEIA